MAFQPQHFGEGFGIGGEIGFHLWCHTTDSDLRAVLKPGYLNAVAGRLRAGDLIWLGISPRFDRARPWEFDPAKVQRFLLMVRAPEKGLVRVRVVMALGSPADEDFPVEGMGLPVAAAGAAVAAPVSPPEAAAGDTEPHRHRTRKPG